MSRDMSVRDSSASTKTMDRWINALGNFLSLLFAFVFGSFSKPSFAENVLKSVAGTIMFGVAAGVEFLLFALLVSKAHLERSLARSWPNLAVGFVKMATIVTAVAGHLIAPSVFSTPIIGVEGLTPLLFVSAMGVDAIQRLIMFAIYLNKHQAAIKSNLDDRVTMYKSHLKTHGVAGFVSLTAGVVVWFTMARPMGAGLTEAMGVTGAVVFGGNIIWMNKEGVRSFLHAVARFCDRAGAERAPLLGLGEHGYCPNFPDYQHGTQADDSAMVSVNNSDCVSENRTGAVVSPWLRTESPVSTGSTRGAMFVSASAAAIEIIREADAADGPTC